MKHRFRVLLFLSVVTVGMLWVLGALAGGLVGQPADDLKLEPAAGGKAVSLAQFKGKPVLLIFWATWCPPCRREIPAIKDLYSKYGAKGLEVVTVCINSRQTRQIVSDFKEKNELPYEVLWDGNNSAADAYQIRAVPTNFLLDSDGVIRLRSNAIEQQMVDLIEQYTKPKAEGAPNKKP
jgi:peroxiredoxin